jgi:superfamily II DNA or RNA helicase
MSELRGQYKLKLWDFSKLTSFSDNLGSKSKLRKKPREYQEDAIEDVLAAFGSGRKRSLVMFATGLGKSIVLAEVARDVTENHGGRVLLLADKVTLIEQLEVDMWPQLPASVPTRLWDGKRKPDSFDGVTVATQQSVLAWIRKGNELPVFDAVLVDECHHAAAPTWMETINALDSRRLLGVTATPWRGDEARITDIFGDPVATMGIIEGIHGGFLADVDYKIFMDDVNWDAVNRNTESRMSITDLNTRLFLPSRDEDMCGKIVSEWNKSGRPQVITFCRSIDHAERVAEVLTSMGMPSRSVHSRGIPQAERARHLMQFKAGEFSNLIGVEILNEGVDVPDVGMIVFVRVTHSRRIFIQQLGRGLRVTPEKSRVMVLDFVADVRRIAEGVRMNSERRELDSEVYRGSGADMVSFGNSLNTGFVDEYLADIADLDDNDEVRLDLIFP